jgi:hypothetical protein
VDVFFDGADEDVIVFWERLRSEVCELHARVFL